MLLSQLAIVFLGITGNHHASIEHQLAPTLEKAGATELVVAEADLGAIVRHTKASRDIVRKLHVDGVVAGALVGSGNATSFRVVIYDGDGRLSSENETPISNLKLAKVDLEVFAMNLKDAVDTIAKQRRPVSRQPRSLGAVRPVANDDDAPPGLPGSKPAPARPLAPARGPDVAVVDSSNQTGLVDTVARSPDGAPAPTTITETRDTVTDHVYAGVTFGAVGRVLTSDPNTVKSYSSTPVGTAGFDVGVEPIRRLSIGAAYERTLVMSSIVAGSSTPSAISRWQATAAYDVVHGAVAIAPVLGIGHRSFMIDSVSNTRTPDSDYTYVMIGAVVTKPIGKRLALRGVAAYEPITGASEPMMLGEASRWAFDVGASLDIRATSHLFVRAALDYQQFSSSWASGTATDGYPTGTLAAGAAF